MKGSLEKLWVSKEGNFLYLAEKPTMIVVVDESRRGKGTSRDVEVEVGR